jgi:hypothetical protein
VIEDLEKMLSRKVRGVSYELTQWGYTLLIVTDKGKSFYFTSDSEIELEVETEN